eukprot:2095397-Prymnesium_polylepis.2
MLLPCVPGKAAVRGVYRDPHMCTDGDAAMKARNATHGQLVAPGRWRRCRHGSRAPAAAAHRSGSALRLHRRACRAPSTAGPLRARSSGCGSGCERRQGAARRRACAGGCHRDAARRSGT